MRGLNMKKKRIRAGTAIVMIVMIALYWAFAALAGEKATEEARMHLEDAVYQAAVTCYAVEGRYPRDLETLIRDYALRYDKESYIIWYDCFADNVIPDIEVRIREK